MSKGEATRQRIIAAAAPIFNQRGFAGCSMQDVLDATGLEKGGLYRHFSNKEELATEAFRFALALSVKRTEHMDDLGGAIARLRYMVDRFVEAPSPLPGGCPLMNTAVDADDGHPALLALAQEGMSDWKQRIACIVEEGQERGEIARRHSPRRVANTVVATLEGALMISRLEGHREALLDARDTLRGLVDSLARGAQSEEQAAGRLS